MIVPNWLKKKNKCVYCGNKFEVGNKKCDVCGKKLVKFDSEWFICKKCAKYFKFDTFNTCDNCRKRKVITQTRTDIDRDKYIKDLQDPDFLKKALERFKEEFMLINKKRLYHDQRYCENCKIYYEKHMKYCEKCGSEMKIIAELLR